MQCHFSGAVTKYKGTYQGLIFVQHSLNMAENMTYKDTAAGS